MDTVILSLQCNLIEHCELEAATNVFCGSCFSFSPRKHALSPSLLGMFLLQLLGSSSCRMQQIHPQGNARRHFRNHRNSRLLRADVPQRDTTENIWINLSDFHHVYKKMSTRKGWVRQSNGSADIDVAWFQSGALDCSHFNSLYHVSVQFWNKEATRWKRVFLF